MKMKKKRTDFFEDMSLDNKLEVYLIGTYVQHHFSLNKGFVLSWHLICLECCSLILWYLV